MHPPHWRDRSTGISTDGFLPYRNSIRDTFGDSASHGVIVKTYSVTQLVKEAQGRYSPAAVVAVSREVVSGDPEQYVSTSYVERQNLSLRMTQKRFARLSNGFSKKLTNHAAAVSLCVTYYNLCRVHEALRTTPGLWASRIGSGPSGIYWTPRRRLSRTGLYGRSGISR